MPDDYTIARCLNVLSQNTERCLPLQGNASARHLYEMGQNRTDFYKIDSPGRSRPPESDFNHENAIVLKKHKCLMIF